jgi:hypothetical protein
MRRFVGLLAAIGFLLAAAAPVVAQGPERSWTEEAVQSFGSEYCGFPVELVDTFSANKTLVFPPDGDGNSRINAPGVIKSTVTNLDSAAAIDVTLGGRVTIFFGGDGSVSAEANGTIFAWYSPAEAAAAETGSGLFLVQGRVTEQYSTEGVLVRADYTGRLVDLCAELEG